MNTKPTQTPAPADSPPLHSRATVVFTGLSYLFTGWGFSFLDRGYGSFGLESVLWLVWAAMGFGAGAMHMGKPGTAGASQWAVLGTLGCVLALFPGFAIYNLLRWASLTLMIVMGARAAVLKTRRDFYFTLLVIFVVSFMVLTHGNANWTLWFYLGPAWICGGFALAWDHAGATPLPRSTKLVMTLGFISASFVLAVGLFFFAPRPPILGFGFLPPGTDTPSMFTQPAGKGDSHSQGHESGTQGAGGMDGTGDTQDTGAQGAWGRQWGAMLQGMRDAAGDTTIPQWQRSAMGSVLDAAQALVQRTQYTITIHWLRWLALLLASYLLWRRRYHLGQHIALGGAWLMTGLWPAQSMRLSAQAMRWNLHRHGHHKLPAQSIREHWMAAATIAPLARLWLGYAVDTYCAMRFGGIAATPQQAAYMRKAVMGACDILYDDAPTTNKSATGSKGSI